MNHRTLIVERNEAGLALADWLCTRLDRPRSFVQRLLRDKHVRVAGTLCNQATRRLRVGQRVEIRLPNEKANSIQPAESLPTPTICYIDEHVLVVEKPAGLTTMRHKEETAEFGKRARFLPSTLADLLPKLIARTKPGPSNVRAVHRLDKDTTGLLVFARSVEAESHLGKQLRAHTVERRYLALVRGQAESQRIESRIARDRGDGRRGTSAKGDGQNAVTHVRVVESLGAYTLVECRLETGRTHQVRIHLGEAGTPLCGERIYDRPLHGQPHRDGSGAWRIMLHAAELGFTHPVTNERMRWTSPMPDDFATLVKRLRVRRSPREDA